MGRDDYMDLAAKAVPCGGRGAAVESRVGGLEDLSDDEVDHAHGGDPKPRDAVRARHPAMRRDGGGGLHERSTFGLWVAVQKF